MHEILWVGANFRYTTCVDSLRRDILMPAHLAATRVLAVTDRGGQRKARHFSATEGKINYFRRKRIRSNGEVTFIVWLDGAFLSLNPISRKGSY
jgi:hypothetical protein